MAVQTGSMKENFKITPPSTKIFRITFPSTYDGETCHAPCGAPSPTRGTRSQPLPLPHTIPTPHSFKRRKKYHSFKKEKLTKIYEKLKRDGTCNPATRYPITRTTDHYTHDGPLHDTPTRSQKDHQATHETPSPVSQQPFPPRLPMFIGKLTLDCDPTDHFLGSLLRPSTLRRRSFVYTSRTDPQDGQLYQGPIPTSPHPTPLSHLPHRRPTTTMSPILPTQYQS